MDIFDGMKQVFEYIREKNYIKALLLVDNLIKEFGDIDQLWYLKGVVLVDMEKYADAVEAFEKAESLGIEPTKNFYSYYGYALFVTRKFDRAAEKFKNALDFEDDPNIRALLILTYSSIRKYEEACKEFEYLKEKYKNFDGLDLLASELKGKC